MAGVTHRLRMTERDLEATLARPEAGRVLMAGILKHGGSRHSHAEVEVPIPGNTSIALWISERTATDPQSAERSSGPVQ